MGELLKGMQDLNELVTTLQRFKEGNADVHELASVTYRDPRNKRLKLPRYSQASGVSASSDEPPPDYSPVESQMLTLFPINIYTPAIDWLLKREAVKKFLFFQVVRRVYPDVTSKPDWETVMQSFIDFVCSTRLQIHMGKAKAAGRSSSKLHFGRFPMPQTFIRIADENMVTLHKVRVDGEKDNATYFRDKCGTLRKTHLLAAKYIVESESIQEMAQKLMWERIDFYLEHRVRTLCCLS